MRNYSSTKSGCIPENESSDVLDKVKSLITESWCEIPDVFIDRSHRIGKGYKGQTQNNHCKNITVRFSIFRHRTLFYWNAKVRLYFTKKRYKIFTDASDFVKTNKNVDINCRLKVFFENGHNSFFDNISNLKNLIAEENTE